jgi:hypothetical protein
LADPFRRRRTGPRRTVETDEPVDDKIVDRLIRVLDIPPYERFRPV